MPVSRDLREFVECLNSNGVEYLIVGALAVSWHGYPRYSADVDFFVRASPPNATRVLAAIQQFGFGGLGLTADDFTAPARVIQLGREPNRIDLMTSISGQRPHRRRRAPQANSGFVVPALPRTMMPSF